MPVVSVLFVFHRDVPHLRPAIASVLAQDFGDFELLLIDNGLGLAASALGPLADDPRVRWVRLARDEGIGVAANAGFAASRGEFIAIMDYDDVAVPHRFSRQVAALRADAGLGLVSGLADRIDGENRPVAGNVFTLLAPGEIPRYAQFAAPIIHPAMMGRREVFAATPFRPLFRYTSELDFYSRVTERWRLAVLPEVLLHYRYYAGQTTQRFPTHIEQSRCLINLLSARRRAGRPEDLESVPPPSDAVSAADYCRQLARQALAEGFAAEAAYMARRSLAVERSVASAWQAARLAWRARQVAAPERRGQVTAMFLRGPVAALGIHPA